MSRHRQHGASGLMIAVVLVLLVLALLASRLLSRLGDAADDKNNTIASLNRAQTALDQFFAAGGVSARLPCPANPATDTGLEDPTPATGNCNSTAGTIPWATIGLRRDDGYDAWGRKLSYRVYNGNNGSLTQIVAGGVSMVNCYDDGTNSPGSGTTSGLCKTDHTTSKLDFLSNGKGLRVTDFGTDHSPNNNDPTAYVVISHGPTGLGGYSASGAVVLTESHHGPGGDEKDNTKDTGPFHIEAWSDPDTSVTVNSHFDDLVAYRTIADLAVKSNLIPRNWPTAGLTFDAARVGAAFGGGTATAGSTSSGSSVNFGSVTATASGGSGPRVSFDVANGTGGIGVSSGGSSTAISSTFGEQIRFDLPASSAQLAVTLNNFGTYTKSYPLIGTQTLADQVRFSFYANNTQVAQVQKAACNALPTMASFALSPGVAFDRVDIKALPATLGGLPFDDTSFYISALSACRAGVSCTSSLATPANTCP